MKQLWKRMLLVFLLCIPLVQIEASSLTLAQAEAQLATAEAQLATAQAQLATANGELAIARGQLERAQAMLNVADTNNVYASNAVFTKFVELRKLKIQEQDMMTDPEYARLRKEQADADENIDLAMSKLDAAQAAESDKNSAVLAAKNKVDEAEGAVTAAKAAKAKAEAAEAKAKDLEFNANMVLAAAEKTVEKANEALAAATAAAKQATAKLAKTTADYNNAEAKLNDINGKLTKVVVGSDDEKKLLIQQFHAQQNVNYAKSANDKATRISEKANTNKTDAEDAQEKADQDAAAAKIAADAAKQTAADIRAGTATDSAADAHHTTLDNFGTNFLGQQTVIDGIVASQQEAAADASKGCFVSDGSPC